MKRLALFLLLAAQLPASVIDAIARVESDANHAAIGDAGKARGAWQMHRGAWDDAARRLGMHLPFEMAHSAREARLIAAEHLRWLNEQFRRRTGRAPTPADSYALWNLGVGGYARRGWDVERCPTITQRAVQKLNSFLQ